MKAARALILACAAALCLAAASDPAERLPDAAQEAHARELFRQIRCVVCQSESIDESEADLARDLRRTVREQVAAGRSDAEIKQFLTTRYGEFILLKPPFSGATLVLWLLPAALLAGAVGVLLAQARRRTPAEAALSPEEEARLRALTAANGPEMASTSSHDGAEDDPRVT
ncbi:MAG: cytochrome c-type biogenesis protein CcmH [Proteobacteria bacterium]|nr:cytochrome c-type biogenesis protein CcmH [Pseudomonadota bacterium]